MLRLSPIILFLAVSALTARAAISISGLTDKSKYNNTVTFTVTADPAATTTTATLDGQPIAVGSPVTVTDIRYHELRAESRDAGGALVDSLLRRFIVKDNAARGGTEDGIPVFTPYNSVNDAPSAFAGGTLKIIAPAAWPVGFPVPMAAKLVNGANETLRLNGLVSLGGFPRTTLKLRRGWGSLNAPALAAPATVNVNAFVNGLTHNPAIAVQAMTFTDVSGTIASNTTWPANSRMRVTSRLTVPAGVTLTIEQGSIVLMDTGTATNGTGAEISVSGTLQIDGVEGNPVVFAPATIGANWGGFEMPAATAILNANWTIFTGAGEDSDWFGNNPGLGGSTHQSEQPTFAVVGSGSGTAIGAQLHLHDCFSFEHAGQQMNSKTNTWIDLQRTLFQKCITSGELNGSKVTIDRSALIEFPSETGNFVDDDNDAIYLTNGDLSITNTVIGFSKDDGVDSGDNGGNSPFGTVNPLTGNTVTRYDSTNNWYEGTYHEGNSLSGTRNVYFTGCVFFNCGQGVEAGYSNGSGGDGPNAIIASCLFANNMVAVRVGDNYGSGFAYNSTADVKNSLILNSGFHDVWSYNWHPTNSNGWIYLDGTTNNTLGRPWFKVENNLLSKPDPLHHPLNTAWNPANPAHAAQIAPFMPVPGSNVGVAISTYAAAQQDTAAYVASHTVRLSTFSSQPVSVGWAVVTKADPFADTGTIAASGTLNFAPGEIIKTISAPIATPGNFGLIHIALSNPVNAEVTGEKVYVKLTVQTPNIVTFGSVWIYKDDGSDQGTAWREVGFNDSGWASGPGELGYGDGDEATVVGSIDVEPGTSGPQRNATTYFRRTFEISDRDAITALDLTVRYDDGGVVYINGQRVAATSGMPIDPAFNYYLGGTAPPDNSILNAAVSPAILVNGTNTIAVEIHQQSKTSSDISFDARLTATISATAVPLALNHTASGGKPVLWWFGTGDILESSTDLLNWLPYPATGSPVSVEVVKPKEFFRLRRPE